MQSFRLASAIAAALLFVSGASGAQGRAVLHVATRANTNANSTYVSDKLADGDPAAILFVTPCYNPGGGGKGVYLSRPLGVWFDKGRKQWAIFTQDRSPMPEGAAFNVEIYTPSTAPGVFVHSGAAATIQGNYTLLDHKLTNGQADATLQVTANFEAGSIYNPHSLGVFYTNRKWAVFNQDGQPMPPGVAFNVLVTKGLVHRASPANTSGHITTLDLPGANGNPNAQLIVTPNYNPGGAGGVYNRSPIGVHYAGGKWTIFNEVTTTPIPAGAAFNVRLAGSGAAVQTASVPPKNPGHQGAAKDQSPATGKPQAPPALPQPPEAGKPAGGSVPKTDPGKSTAQPQKPAGKPGAPLLSPNAGAANLQNVKPNGSGVLQNLPVDWDFENGMTGWRALEGDPFADQPLEGDYVSTRSIRTEVARLIGGDYWDGYYPIGYHGRHWFSTGYTGQRGAPPDPRRTGVLVSNRFRIAQPFLSYLASGVGRGEMEVQLFVQFNANNGEYDRLGLLSPVENGFARVGGVEIGPVVTPDDIMVRKVVPISQLIGREAYVKIIDRTRDGYLNVDDFEFGQQPPQRLAGRWDKSAPVWGFADFHAHPVANLGFGGQLYVGDPLAPLSQMGSCENTAHGFKGLGLPRTSDNDLLNYINIVGQVYPLVRVAMVGIWDALPKLDPGVAAIITAVDVIRAIFNPWGTLVSHLADVNVRFDAAMLERIKKLAYMGIEERFGHDTNGYPKFQDWPRWNSRTHQHMHRDWIKRAYDGGLRLMVALAVDSDFLARINPKEGVEMGDRPSYERQLRELHRMAELNADWMGIARTPAQARQLILSNKLALVLGVEVDSIGNFGAPGGPQPTQEAINAEITRLYRDLDVRHIFPIHLADSLVGGCSIYSDIFNLNHFALRRGRLHDVEDGRPYNIDFQLFGHQEMNAANVVSTLRQFIQRTGLFALPLQGLSVSMAQLLAEMDRTRSTYAVPGHINSVGLDPQFGLPTLRKMMDLGMIIDVDHMGHKSTQATISLARSREGNGIRGYPLASGHTTFRPMAKRRPGTGETAREDPDEHKWAHESDKSDDAVRAIRELGGVVGPQTIEKDYWETRGVIPGMNFDNDAPGTSKDWAMSYLYAVDKMGGHGVGMGTDMAMLGAFGARFGTGAVPAAPAGAVRRARAADQEKPENAGVRYNVPLRDFRSYRFPSAITAISPDEIYSQRQRDFWEALAIWRANASEDFARREMPQSIFERTWVQANIIMNFVKGLRATNQSQLQGEGAILDNTYNEQRAAYLLQHPADRRPNETSDRDGVLGILAEITPVWNRWQRMENAAQRYPINKYAIYTPNVNGYPYTRDFDYNLEGLAHYGLLPDMLQDVHNVGVTNEQLAPLFRSAEDYIRMWEKIEAMRAMPSLTPGATINPSALQKLQKRP